MTFGLSRLLNFGPVYEIVSHHGDAGKELGGYWGETLIIVLSLLFCIKTNGRQMRQHRDGFNTAWL